MKRAVPAEMLMENLAKVPLNLLKRCFRKSSSFKKLKNSRKRRKNLRFRKVKRAKAQKLTCPINQFLNRKTKKMTQNFDQPNKKSLVCCFYLNVIKTTYLLN